MKRIVFIQLFNNFSGSPNVLSVVVRGFVKKGYEVEIITSKGDGFLSNIEGATYRYLCYKWIENSKIKTLFWMIAAQIELFFKVLFCSKKETTYYINTVMPFGAALACRLSRKDMIYHVHENMRQRKPLYGIYRTIYRWCNIKTIFVSKYVAFQAIGCRGSKVVYNGLDDEFYKASHFIDFEQRRNVLMVCSLRRFKGVYEFVELAKRLLDYSFELVVSDSAKSVAQFISEVNPSENLIIHDRQTNLSPFYSRAKVLLSLSDTTQWVETFGLTIVEAKVYGIPSIVPPSGGPLELIRENVDGYIADSKNIAYISELITQIYTDNENYQKLAKNAFDSGQDFESNKMINEIEKYITK